jgi:dGTPase
VSAEHVVFDPAYWFDRRHRVDRSSDSLSRTGDGRTPAQRDRDRILYSSAFRRLAGITQVASPTELYPVHNRLIHSLKVAQVGRSLAVRLTSNSEYMEQLAPFGGIDPDIVEAAALAHDLGHPPFGHVAEQELDNLLVKGGNETGLPDGFNGNAQSFRIITKLSVRYAVPRRPEIRGLDLTRASLNAVLKYPWMRANQGKGHTKWGAYHAENDDFTWVRRNVPYPRDGRTIEASLMDWADDITYAVHDVEDFVRAGLIPLDRFNSDARERDQFLAWAIEHENVSGAEADRLEDAFLKSRMVAHPGLPGPYRGSRMDRAALRSLTAELIGKYVNNSVSLVIHEGSPVIHIDPELEAEVRILKALTWRYVIESPALVAQRFGQRTLIRSLFRTFCDAAMTTDEWSIFPEYFREEVELARHDVSHVKRIVADLISSMSESQVVAIHQRLTGQSLGSAMDAYLQ